MSIRILKRLLDQRRYDNLNMSSPILKCKNSPGYVTLISVLIVGATGAAITVSIILLGLGVSRTSLAYQQLHQAKALAHGCAEEALEQIRSSTSFTGTGGLTLGQGTCAYTVSNTGGQTRSIVTSGTVGTIIRRNSLTITAINPRIIVSTWQEIP